MTKTNELLKLKLKNKMKSDKIKMINSKHKL